jgi:hypothetical protein
MSTSSSSFNWYQVIPMVLFFSLALVCVGVCQNANVDLLVKRDGTILEVKIVEVKQEEVLYRKVAGPEGPIYAIEKRELLSAKYSSGETLNFTVTVESFYDEKPVATSVSPTGERYKALPPKNDFQTKVLALQDERLEHNFNLFRAASKKGKTLGFVGVAVQIGLSLTGTIVLAANTETYGGQSYHTNPTAARSGALMMIGGTVVGGIMGTSGFVRAAKNGNKAKYIRDEMRRRGVPLRIAK